MSTLVVDDALRRAGAVIAEHAGLRATAATEPRLAASLQERSAARRLDLDAYVGCLAAEPAERQALLELLTVQETSFFRDGAQLDALVRHILPRTPRPIVIWSAGCSTGQEPYSLAMALDEAGCTDWWIVASDVSERAVARTRSATYTAHERRGLSPARAGRYLERAGERYRVVPELRERVSVVHSNVALDPPPVAAGTCTAVFCRNVFIYLRRERVTACLGTIHERLTPKGVLFLGGSETLGRNDPRYRLARFGDVFAYERADTVAVLPGAVVPATPARPKPVVPRVDGPLDVLRRSPMPGGDELRRQGEAAARAGDHAAAATAFRKAVYVDADDIAAHLGLGFSLEAIGDREAGLRAFAAAQAALDRIGAPAAATALEGYAEETVRLVLAAKLGGRA